jgi:hypothetical protein
MGGPKKKLKKPSVTNSKRPDEVIFFIDASLGGKIVAQALRDADAKVEIHNDHFAQGTPDHEWLAAVGDKGWVVLTKDERIRYHELERLALMDAGVRAFVLTAKGLRGTENAEILVKAQPSMRRLLKKQAGPFIAKVTRGIEVTLIVSGYKKKRKKK